MSWKRFRWSLYTPFYDVLARRLARGRRRALELLAVQPGEHVLIDGCGTGLDLELLPPAAVVTATDLTPSMIERTRERAATLGLSIDARVMDAARLDFPDAAFDCVVLHLILAVVPDPIATIREAARVLRPGGRVSIFDKFLPDDRAPSPIRRFANVVTNVVAIDINRRLAPLLAAAGLRVVHEETLWGGWFRVVVGEVPWSANSIASERRHEPKDAEHEYDQSADPKNRSHSLE